MLDVLSLNQDALIKHQYMMHYENMATHYFEVTCIYALKTFFAGHV